MNKEEKGTVLEPMRELLQRWLDFHTASAGFTPEVLASKAKFAAFGDEIAEREQTLIADTRTAIAAQQRAETPPEPLCMCKDRTLSQCPGEWEPGCDLGNNENFARPGMEDRKELRRKLNLEARERRSGIAGSWATPPERAETLPVECRHSSLRGIDKGRLRCEACGLVLCDAQLDYWPSAKVIVHEDEATFGVRRVTATLYAPGLPPGEYDMWLPPSNPLPERAETPQASPEPTERCDHCDGEGRVPFEGTPGAYYRDGEKYDAPGWKDCPECHSAQAKGAAQPDQADPNMGRLTALWRFGVSVLPPSAPDFYAWLDVLDAAIDERVNRSKP